MASADEKPESPANSGSEGAPKVDGTANGSDRLPFAIPEPIREDQVQNAVNFLSHPKVRGSPVIYRRSFLEKKGLTKEEIDEAFRRMPDPPSNSSTVDAVISNHDNQPKSAANTQFQAPSHAQQAVAPPVVSAIQKPRFQWSIALYALGILSASGAGTAFVFKNMIIPRFKAWILKVVKEDNESKKEDKTKPNLAEDAAEAAKAAVSAAAIVAKASEELLSARTEERKYFEAFMEMMDAQVKEIKSLSTAVHKLENSKESFQYQDKLLEENAQHARQNGQMNSSWRPSQVDSQPDTSTLLPPKQIKQNGVSEIETGSVRQSSVATATSLEYPKSYMEIMAMIQRGETPPGIKDINDMPPNPNQPPSKPLLAPRPKPWETVQQTQQRSAKYGETSVTEGIYSEAAQLNGKNHEFSEPSWKKTVKITELEDELDDPRQFYGPGSAKRSGPSGSTHRGWVPPQPPAVAMPEAAAAIRHPKPSPQKQQLEDSRFSVPSDLEGGGEDAAAETAHEVAFEAPAAARESEIQEIATDGDVA